MPLPTSPTAYPDVRAVLDSALSAGGGFYSPPVPPGRKLDSTLKYWLMRARTFRKLTRNAGDTTYNSLDFQIDGSRIRIDVIGQGTLVSLDGDELDISSADDLDIDLDALRKDIGDI